MRPLFSLFLAKSDQYARNKNPQGAKGLFYIQVWIPPLPSKGLTYPQLWKCIKRSIELWVFWVADYLHCIRFLIQSWFWWKNPIFRLEMDEIEFVWKIKQSIEIRVFWITDYEYCFWISIQWRFLKSRQFLPVWSVEIWHQIRAGSKIRCDIRDPLPRIP